MMKVNEKNRKVDLLAEASNWEAKRKTEKIWCVARSALKNNRNHEFVWRTMKDQTVVEKELPKECRKLVATTPKLVKLTAQQKINCFLPVRL